jgi:hypothetical protein
MMRVDKNTKKTMDAAISAVYGELVGIVNRTMESVAEHTLVKTEHGVVIYNKYVLRKTVNGVELYVRAGVQPIISFSCAKHALIWAILDHNNKIMEAKRVRELDTQYAGVTVDVAIHTKLRSSGNSEKYLINSSKLQHDLDKQKQIVAHLDKYTIVAQGCQNKQGTYHETQRNDSQSQTKRR